MERKIDRREFIKLFGLGLGMAACSRVGVSPDKTSTEIPSQIVPTETMIPPTLTPEPSPTPDTRSYFEMYIYPALSETAKTRREEKARQDPDFWHRVDSELNKDRINFVLLGFGSERALTDSIQVISLDTQKADLRVVSIPRDTWAPEVTEHTGRARPYRINQAYVYGKLPLVEKIIEDATGLSADFAVGMHMDVLSRAVKEIFDDKLEMCIPWPINDLEMGYFRQGLQSLNGEEVLKISRARKYTAGSNSSRNFMQQLVLKAMIRRVKSEISEGVGSAAGSLGKSLIFLDKETRNGSVVTNFDPGLFLSLGANLVQQIAQEGLGGGKREFGMPDFSARHEIKTENALDPNDVTRHKPIGGDPKAEDLVQGYWLTARTGIKDFLTSPADLTGFEVGETCPASQ